MAKPQKDINSHEFYWKCYKVVLRVVKGDLIRCDEIAQDFVLARTDRIKRDRPPYDFSLYKIEWEEIILVILSTMKKSPTENIVSYATMKADYALQDFLQSRPITKDE